MKHLRHVATLFMTLPGLFVLSGRLIADDAIAKAAAETIGQHCLECHSGQEPKGGLALTERSSLLRGGESGAVFLPDDRENSLLLSHVVDGVMPPESRPPLSDQERQVLRHWILAAAPYPEQRLSQFARTTKTRAGYDWWSLQPIQRPDLPLALSTAWVRNSIDAFVLQRLMDQGLKPSGEAPPTVLLRRLYFDLVGLPPTPEQIADFLADPSDEAYCAIVDQLLDSPHYGERWARHWLDVARFGESDGFERNNVREHQWHFRDWVIRSLNHDLPYDQFVRMQIAGDHLRPGRDGFAAAAFLTAGVHNTVVGGSEFMKKTARQDELEEIAAAVAQTFVGLTVNCARCHDHKFDPISQAEYYQFVSALSGVFHGEKSFRNDQVRQAIDSKQTNLARTMEELAALEQPIIDAIRQQRQTGEAPTPPLPRPTFAWEFEEGLTDAIANVPGRAVGRPRVENGALVVDDGKSYVETQPLKVGFGAKTLEAYVQLSNLDQRGGGVISLQTPDGAVFDAIVFGEREARRWMAGSDGFRRSQEFGGLEEAEANQRPVHLAITYSEDGEVRRYRNGQLYGKVYQTALQRFEAGQVVVRFGIRHLPAGGNMHLKGRIYYARLYDRVLNPGQLALSAGVDSDYVATDEIASQFNAKQRSEHARLLARRDALLGELKTLQSTEQQKVYTVSAKDHPGVTRRLRRGNAMDEAGVVMPGGLTAVTGPDAHFGLAPDATDDKRRRRLAEWIAGGENPLFARVAVNRLWHHHFGAGIVRTPNDFGFNGGRPSHPLLLDWLADEFRKQNWSLKAMHRLMVTSATYRQSSLPVTEAIDLDADNRLLWRKSPTRLDAESLRDAMLAVSGKLNSKRFGPGFRDVKVAYLDGTTYYTPFDREDAELHRRTIYRFSPRGGRSSILDTFDCPDPANAAPARSVTTTPLQALALMNNEFALRIAGHFGARILRDGGTEPTEQVDRAFLLAFGRRPSNDELDAARQVLIQNGPRALARVLFNSNEFIVIE